MHDDKEQVHRFEKVDRTMEADDFGCADSVRLKECNRPANSFILCHEQMAQCTTKLWSWMFSAVIRQFCNEINNPSSQSEVRKPWVCIKGNSRIKRIKRQDMSREISGVNLYLQNCVVVQ